MKKTQIRLSSPSPFPILCDLIDENFIVSSVFCSSYVICRCYTPHFLCSLPVSSLSFSLCFVSVRFHLNPFSSKWNLILCLNFCRHDKCYWFLSKLCKNVAKGELPVCRQYLIQTSNQSSVQTSARASGSILAGHASVSRAKFQSRITINKHSSQTQLKRLSLINKLRDESLWSGEVQRLK